ncbi:MAG: TonB-dependent receptor plug domain-containing protein, partial [Chitinivibrionales bacterium]|nr:TonB-dependent receptor plug domain-containing protein [Chitinivibrionales bacterium]
VISDRRGEAVGNALVFLRDQDRSVRSDYMGRFTFDSLASGVYSVAAVADGYDTSSTHDVDVWSGEMTTLNLAVREQLEISEDSLIPSPDRGLFTGLVVDADKGQPIPGAEVVVHGERGLKSVTDLNGRYVIRDVSPGPYALEASHAKYTTQVTSGVQAAAGRKTVTDFVLSTSDVSQMARMSIRALAIKNTGAALLKERQQAINLTDAIGAQEMSRAGAGNAADAMKTVTGVTIVDGKYVIIRGLPASYTTVMLNGAPLPYPDPDVKAFPLDLFPSGVLENITVYKTFTPDLPPYWAGGVVDVRTKPFPDKLELSASVSHSYNTQSTFSDDYLTYDGGSLDWLGFDDGTRDLPEVYEEYTKTEIDRYYGIPAVPFDEQRTVNRLNDPTDTLYESLQLLDEMAKSLDTIMVPHTERAGVDQGYSFSVGNTLRLFDRPLGFRAGLTYSNNYSLSLEDRRTSYSFNQFDHSLPEGAQKVDFQNDFTMTNSANKVLWSVLANGAYELSENHKLKLDYLYVRKAEDKIRRVFGYYSYYDGSGDFDTRRLHYVQRSLNYLQTMGSHRLRFGAMPMIVDWRGSYTAGSQDEPDMRNSYHFVSTDTAGNPVYKYEANVDQPSHQWRELNERSGSAQLEIALPFYQWNGDSATAKVGGGWIGRWRERRQRYIEYQLDQYISDIGGYAGEIDPQKLSSQDLVSYDHVGLLPDSINDPSTTPPTEATLTGYRPGMFVRDQSNDHAQWGGTKQTVNAFAMVELPLFGPVAVTGGLRFEYGYLHGETTVEYSRLKDSTIADSRDIDYLPAISVNTKVRDDMNVRLAYGRTLIVPSMREKAPYKTSSFTGGPQFEGNRHVESSDVDNVDARWEWFMRPGELIAASAFYKLIHNPIETRFFENDIRVPDNTSSDAHILGLELEARKVLDMVHWLRHFQVSGNLTLAYSRVYLDPEMRKIEAYFPEEAGDHRPYQGQSPFVVNLFLTYDNPDIGMNVNLYYNVFGERLAELTDVDQPWLWERPQHLLNLTWKQKVSERWMLEGKAKNLLFSTSKLVHHYDGRMLVVQEEKPGATFSLKASFKL